MPTTSSGPGPATSSAGAPSSATASAPTTSPSTRHPAEQQTSGLAPTFIDVGTVDVFRDEDVAFAFTIWASGGAAALHVWPGGYHGVELLAPTAALSTDAYEARRRWLARLLATVGGEPIEGAGTADR